MNAHPEHEEFDVIINGGGMVGLSLAIALAQSQAHMAQMRVALIEKTALADQLEPTFDGRVSAIAYGSKCILDAIGVWPHIAGEAEPIQDIRVSDGNTPFFLHFDHEQIGDNPFGYIVENRYTRHAMHRVARSSPTLTVMDSNAIQRIEGDADGVTVGLASGKTLRCRLLVGAEGRQSAVRDHADIPVTRWSYHQTAIVCTIHHTGPHHGLAQERFLPAGPFAVLPMTRIPGGSYRSSLVWVEPDDRVQLYMELPDEELVQEIRERVGNYLGEITVGGPRFAYPLSLMHAKRYIADRLVLVGDAAHGMHPVAGQGLNMGFRDVAVLSELLVAAFRDGGDIGSPALLSRYQQSRRFDNVAMLAATDGLTRLFSTRFIPVKLARGLGLWTVGKLPALKSFFMRDAMGLAGKIPQMINEKK